MSETTYHILLAVISAALLFALLLVLYFTGRYHRARREKEDTEKRYRELESRVHTLQLDSLEARLNPHLFKNVLNSIQSHAYQTYFALDKLAHILDYILYESKNGFVSPAEEISFALSFIEINKIKVSPLFQLNVKTRVKEAEPAYTARNLAPMISVDLIENAFKHADLQSADAFITIIFECTGNHFQLTVSNKISSRPQLRKEKSGIGSDTLGQRLRILYKDRYTLQRYTEGDVYIAQLKIDLTDDHTQMPVTGR